jgi:hypothetical protein
MIACALAGALLVTACGDDPTEPLADPVAGSYLLHRVSGNRVPSLIYEYEGTRTYFGEGEITLRADGSCHSSMTYHDVAGRTLTRRSYARDCTYAVSGTTVELMYDDDDDLPEVATLDRGRLMLSTRGLDYEYRRR